MSRAEYETSLAPVLINELLDLANSTVDGPRSKAGPSISARGFKASSRILIPVHPSDALEGADGAGGDGRRFRSMKKVLYNLLSNTFKFSDPQAEQVWIRLIAKDQSVELEVEDNGIGIPREQLTRIFDRFTQVEGGATRRYEGGGIGLALVKEIVALHGGTIARQSDLGRGSIFSITLPRGNVTQDQVFTIPESKKTSKLFFPFNQRINRRPRLFGPSNSKKMLH